MELEENLNTTRTETVKISQLICHILGSWFKLKATRYEFLVLHSWGHCWTRILKAFPNEDWAFLKNVKGFWGQSWFSVHYIKSSIMITWILLKYFQRKLACVPELLLQWSTQGNSGINGKEGWKMPWPNNPTTTGHGVVDVLSKMLKSKVLYLLGHAHSLLIDLTLECLRISFATLDILHQRWKHNFL